MEKDIDGLIFKFGGKESFRVTNPEIALQKTEKKEEKPSDIYNLTLVILQEFITSLDFTKIKLKEKTFEDRYIEFISQVFKLFLESPQYKKNFEKGVDFELPAFLSRAESNVNFKFVKDPEVLSELEKSNTNRELFKIMMASMRSHKKRPSGFFSKELIYHHNALVDKVADYIDEGVKSSDKKSTTTLKEASLVSFREFKKVFLTESNTWQEEFGKEVQEEKVAIHVDEESQEDDHLEENVIFPTYDAIKKSQTLDTVSKPLAVLNKIVFNSPAEETTKKKTPVCVLMGKFQPFHNGHKTIIQDANTASGCKVFLVITTKRIPSNGISRDLHKSMIDEALAGNKDICGYIFSDGRSIGEVIKDIPDKYNVKAFAGSEEECEDISTQTKRSLETYPMTRHVSSKQVFQKIKEEDYDGYKKLVPSTLHNYFYKLRNEIIS
jgi:phosphopantetheine adenylyltransferase